MVVFDKKQQYFGKDGTLGEMVNDIRYSIYEHFPFAAFDCSN
jgi:hypothetical protein